MGGKTNRKASGGSALIAVICAAMVITALSLSLLLATSVLLAAGRRSAADERCCIMAQSISRLVDLELTDRFYDRLPSGIPEDECLWGYAGALPGRAGERQAFRMDSRNNGNWPAEAGEVTISLWWSQEGGQGTWGGEQDKSREEEFWERDLDLYVEITCAGSEGAYTLTNIYHKVNGKEENSWKWSRLVERE